MKLNEAIKLLDNATFTIKNQSKSVDYSDYTHVGYSNLSDDSSIPYFQPPYQYEVRVVDAKALLNDLSLNLAKINSFGELNKQVDEAVYKLGDSEQLHGLVLAYQ